MNRINITSLAKEEFEKILKEMVHDFAFNYKEEATFITAYILDKSGGFEDGIPQHSLLQSTNALIQALNIILEEREKVQNEDRS